MTPRRPWWRSSKKRHRHKFTTTLPSDLPGAQFTGTFTTHWRAQATAAHIEPFIRRHLYNVAESVSATYPVDQLRPTTDEIQVALAVLQFQHPELGTVDVSTTIRLTTDAASQELQTHRLTRLREQQIHTEVQDTRLQALSHTAFADRPTALLWAVLTFPDLVTETRGEILHAAIDQIHPSSGEPAVADERQQAAAAVIEWITDDTPRRHQELQTILRVLDQLGGYAELCRGLQAFTTSTAFAEEPSSMS